MLDDVETLMNDLNEVTEEAQQASITQNLCEVSQQIAAALETGDSGLGPLNAAWTSMFMSAGACALTMGGMGYSSYSADQAEEEQQTLSNEQLQNSTHGLSEASDNVVEQAQAGTLTDKSISELQANTSAAKAAASHSSVAATAAEDTKQATTASQSLARVAKVQRAQQELESALEDAQKTNPSTPEQLEKIDEAADRLNQATEDFKATSPDQTSFDADRPDIGNPNEREIYFRAKGAAAEAKGISTPEKRARLALQRAQRSTQDAVNHPEDEAKQKQAEAHINAAKFAAQKGGVTQELRDSADAATFHASKALYHARFKPGGPNEGGTDYAAMRAGDIPSGLKITPTDAARAQLGRMSRSMEASGAANDVDARDVQNQVAASLRGDGPLKTSEEKNIEVMRDNAGRVRTYSEKTSENVTFFSDKEGGGLSVEGYRPTYSRSERIAATKRVNTEVQKLAAASKKYEATGSEADKDALKAQRDKTEETINNPENANAHSAVQESARQAHASSDPKLPAGSPPYSSERTQQAASRSRVATANTENRKTTGLSQNYQGHFQNVFGWFSAINMMNSSVGALITAKGNMSSKLDEQQAGIDQAAGSAYGEGLTLSNQNAQLLESILASLESTYSQMSQSQTQDVSFVRGAN